MKEESSTQVPKQALRKTDVMPRLSSEQIESIEFIQIGDMFPKRLKKVEVSHPMQNVYGLVRIGEDYYKWVSLNGA